MLWTDKSAVTVQQTLKEAKRRVRKDYVRRVSMQQDFYDGDHASWMEGTAVLHPDDEGGYSGSTSSTSYLQRYFPNAWDNGSGSLCPQYLPVIQRFTDTVAALFHRKAELGFDLDGEEVPESDSQMQTWRLIEKSTQLHQMLKQWQRSTYLHKTSPMHVRWSYGQLALEPLSPADWWAWESYDNPVHLQAAQLAMHELPQPINNWAATIERRYAVWEHDEKTGAWTFHIRNQFGKDLGDSLFRDGLNHYGQFPYVVAHEGIPRKSIFQDLDDSLLTAQIGLDLLWTDYHLACRMDGGVLTLKSATPKTGKDLPFGRDRALALGSEDSAAYIQATQNLGAMVDFGGRWLKTFAVMHGLHPDLFAIDGSSFSTAISAVAKRIDRLDVQETREDREAYWEVKLAELFDLIRIVWNFWNPARRLDPRLVLKIKWSEPENAVSPLEQAQADQAKINAGLTNPVEIIMRDRRCSREEAERCFEENLRWLERRAAVMPTGTRQTPDPLKEGM